MKAILALLVLAIVACVYAQQHQLSERQGGVYAQAQASGESKSHQKRGIFGGYGFGYPYGGYGGFGYPYGGFGGFGLGWAGGYGFPYGGFYG